MSDQQQALALEQAINLAIQHHSAGRLSEAEQVCRQILEKDSNQPVVLHLLGVTSHQLGKNDAAVDFIRKALDLRSDLPDAHYHLAIVLQALGRLDEAETSYGAALGLRPDNAGAHNNLGNVLQSLQQPEKAVASFRKALGVKPNYAEAHNNLGLALRDLGNLDEALASCQMALTLQPEYAEAHANIGLALQDLGQFEEAITSYRKALDLKPDYAMIHNNLGTSLQYLGRLDEAMASYQKALDLQPELAEAHNNLGNTLQDLGRLDDAITRYRQAVALKPENALFWANFAASLRTVSFASVDDDLCRDLLRLLEQPTVPPAYIARSAVSALRLLPDFSRIAAATDFNAQDSDVAYSAIAGQLSAFPLFLKILQLSQICDLEMERMLTGLRRAMMAETIGGKTAQSVIPFTAALAQNCFTNEYVFAESEDESEAVEQVQQRIAGQLENRQAVSPSDLIALAAYRPLFAFPWAQQLSEREWEDNVKSVILRHVTEALKERSLRNQISAVTAIEDRVSQSVRAQYEESPYPRWIKAGLAHKSSSLGAVLRGSPLFFNLADDFSPGRPEILMAGCGTGQHALYMNSRFSNARVLAVDLSLNSLAYALRKSRELGLANIEYVHGDILKLANLGRQFDLIGCAGVLHHLGDPLAGWRVLVDLLRPGGVMKIGLYSETARQHLAAGRSLIAEKGYTASAQDIRQCRQDIIALAAGGNREMEKICNGEDFFSLSRCRDLLFHVQERRFNLPEIEAALESLELNFIGFELDDRRTLHKFRESHPDHAALTSLSLWHQFELNNPDTFNGMYQFWCQK